MTRRAKLATGGALVVVATGLTGLASAPPQNPQPAGDAAIFSAVKADDVAKVKTLVETEPGLVRTRDDTGRTPLHWAARGASVTEKALAGSALERLQHLPGIGVVRIELHRPLVAADGVRGASGLHVGFAQAVVSVP
jgi:hypothetical protein